MTISELKQKYVDYLVNEMKTFIHSNYFTDTEGYNLHLSDYTPMIWNIICTFHLTENFIATYRKELLFDLDPTSLLSYIQLRINKYFKEEEEEIHEWGYIPIDKSMGEIFFDLLYDELENTIAKAVVTRYFPEKMLKEGFIDGMVD